MPISATTPAAPAPGAAQPSSLIAGVYLVPMKTFGDSRGFFYESYRKSWIPGAREMVQGNCSFSKAGVLRGLHYHLKQADLWGVPVGAVRAVLYDCRASSPTRGASQIVEMGEDNRVSLYIPKGVAHGFRALRESYMTYLVDELYDNSDELGILWNDPALGIDWGSGPEPILSDRDKANPRLADIPADRHAP